LEALTATGIWVIASSERRQPLCENRVVIDLRAHQVIDLPVDQLGLLILNDLLKNNEWNEYNYLLAAHNKYRGEPSLAISQAMTWLRA
jgi:hypothetical protein